MIYYLILRQWNGKCISRALRWTATDNENDVTFDDCYETRIMWILFLEQTSHSTTCVPLDDFLGEALLLRLPLTRFTRFDCSLLTNRNMKKAATATTITAITTQISIIETHVPWICPHSPSWVPRMHSDRCSPKHRPFLEHGYTAVTPTSVVGNKPFGLQTPTRV